MTRRRFLGSVAALGVAGVGAARSGELLEQPRAAAVAGPDDRALWLGTLERIATPVFENLSRRTLRRAMPVEAADPASRSRFTHLEAFGRVLCGVAPWLAATGLGAAEASRQQRFIALAAASSTPPQTQLPLIS